MRERRLDPDKDRSLLGKYKLILPDISVLLSMIRSQTLKKTAEILGCNQATILKRLKVTNPNISFKRNTRVCLVQKQLHKLYFEDKKSFSDIIKETGATMWHIQSSFKKYGWTPRSQVEGNIIKNRLFDDQHIIDTYKKFESTVAAASELNMTPQGIDHILRKHNVEQTGNTKMQKNAGERVLSGWLTSWGVAHVCNWSEWDHLKIVDRWNHIDIYVPSYKLFIEFHGVNYHKHTVERDTRKKIAFLSAYPDHRWLIVTDEEIANKSIKTVTKENLRHKFLVTPLAIKDLKFNTAPDIRYALNFLDKQHIRKRSRVNTYIFSVELNDIIVGVATFGKPQDIESIYDYEFKRLALCPELPINTSSWFISECVKQFDSGTKLITYIDSEHLGSSFMGANWIKIGETNKRNAYCFVKGEEKIDRRMAWKLAKAAGMMRSVWATANGYARQNEKPKQIFEFIVK